MRVKHMFSIYLLGIYCYDNIEIIKKCFNDFIENNIWPKTNEKTSAEDKPAKLKKDFLYLWFLTALFHDMGYMFEDLGDNDNSQYSFIIERKNMMASNNLGAKAAILGIPKDIRWGAKEYFWQRRNNRLFHESLCTDHGFAGGFLLFEKLRDLHCNHNNDGETGSGPTNNSGLIFDPLIFEWYNVPSAWAIICHNIWTAFAGTGKADKYEQLGLGKLIFYKDQSPICLKSHPLLFLLDFLDTLDPFKRFYVKRDDGQIDYDILKEIYMTPDKDSLKMRVKCNRNQGNNCNFCSFLLKKIEGDIAFLNSSSFLVKQEGNEVVFSFCKNQDSK